MDIGEEKEPIQTPKHSPAVPEPIVEPAPDAPSEPTPESEPAPEEVPA